MYLFLPGWYSSNSHRKLCYSSLSLKCCHFSRPPARSVMSTHGTHLSTQFLESLRLCSITFKKMRIQRLGHQRVKHIWSGLIQLDHLAFFAPACLVAVFRSTLLTFFLSPMSGAVSHCPSYNVWEQRYRSVACRFLGNRKKKAHLASDVHLLATSISCNYATVFHTNTSVRSSDTLG